MRKVTVHPSLLGQLPGSAVITTLLRACTLTSSKVNWFGRQILLSPTVTYIDFLTHTNLILEAGKNLFPW